MMLIKKIKWTSFRLFFYLLIFLNFISFGLFAYLIAPLISYMFLKDWRFWKNISYFKKLYPAINIYVSYWFKKDYKYFVSNIPLSAAPMRTYDKTLFKTRDTWEHGDSCGDCIECCTIFNCFFLNLENKKCMCYDSLFWNYFNCGRFPVNEKQIGFYKCPRFVPIST